MTSDEVSVNNIQHNVQNQDDQCLTTSVQWHTPVTAQHSIFSSIVGNGARFSHSFANEQVIWPTENVQLNGDIQQPSTICIPTVRAMCVYGEENYVLADSEALGSVQKQKKKLSHPKNTKQRPIEKQRSPKKRHSVAEFQEICNDPIELEENAQQVKERFEKGCECQEDNCFKGLSAEYVYRHRLNIAELTKGEHDMYLMGVTMAVLANPEETVRHKERQRLRAQYVFQGRKVCLAAFLYLENCTHYQLKRIRKHVMTHGVAPRVHGNHGKKPHNTFPLDSYRHATSFLKKFIEQHAPCVTTSNSSNSVAQSPNINNFKTKGKQVSKTAPLYLPSEITRKTIHNAYMEFCKVSEPSIKVMGYSTFRHFMKEQFPYVKFCKLEGGLNKILVSSQMNMNGNNTIQTSVVPTSQQSSKVTNEILTLDSDENCPNVTSTSLVGSGQLTAIPVVLSQQTSQSENIIASSDLDHDQDQPTTFIVTPVSQLLQAPLSSNSGTLREHDTYCSYQVTAAPTAGHQCSEHGMTVASIQDNSHGSTFTFTTV